MGLVCGPVAASKSLYYLPGDKWKTSGDYPGVKRDCHKNGDSAGITIGPTGIIVNACISADVPVMVV